MAHLLWRPLRAAGNLPGGGPRRLVSEEGTRRRVYTVARVLESWREVGEWWRGEEELQAFRLLLEDGGVLEVVFLRRSRRWILTRVYD